MKKGDTILSLDSKSVANLSDLQGVMVGLAVGSTIKVGYLRDGQRLETEATLAEKTKLYADWYDARAQRGDSEAEFALGLLYFRGEGKPKDTSLAFEWVSKAAVQGEVRAQEEIGALYSEGIGAPKDESKAVEWWLKAAQQGSSGAEDSLGNAYRLGRGVTSDKKQAFFWYSKAANLGLPSAQFHLAFFYFQGVAGVPQDYSQAAMWYRKAADQGYAAAQFSLGGMYESGQGVSKDMDEALTLFRKAADQGYTLAQVYLANIYATGVGAAKNQVLALSYFQSAASHGNAEAQNGLAFMLESGDGTTQDCKAALDLYQKSAAQGWGPATSNLGSLYFWGICGVPRNQETAFKYFKAAAEQGQSIAELMLADIYDEGTGTAKDDAQAAAWYRKAAERGIAVAQNNLGYFYSRSNFDEAKRWFAQAADNGDPAARYNLRYLSDSDSDNPPQQICEPFGQSSFCKEKLIGWQFARDVFNHMIPLPSIVEMGPVESCGQSVSVVPPAYPPLARKLELQGSYSVSVNVTGGTVSYVSVNNSKTSTNPDTLLKIAIEEAAKHWSFPACPSSERYMTQLNIEFSLAESHPINLQAVSSAEQCYQSAGISEVPNPGNSSWCEEGFKQANIELQEKAKEGDAKALTRMAFIYEHGQGVAKNSAEAFRKYAQAAEKGEADAAFRMGRYYDEGEQVAQDRSKAFKIYLQSAKSGFDPAAFRVAVMYESGIGTAKSTAEAINWYRKCQGFEEAKAALRRLVPDKQVPPDGAARAAARRAYAGILENQMRQSLRANTDVDPTLVRLRVATMTPQSSEGNTREDYRLTIESNGYALPRDVTKLLHNYSMNGQLYALGFRELSFQDAVGEQMGTILCAVQLTEKGAHPAYCMHMENINYVGGSYGEGVWRPGWKEYYTWPADYVVTSTP
jgi:hypothetical protein